MTEILNEKHNALEDELERSRAELSSVGAKPHIAHSDIIANIKENWDYLNNAEKMIFLQRFVEKIEINVEKLHKKSNIVRIESIEFNTDPLIEGQKKGIVRSKLQGIQR